MLTKRPKNLNRWLPFLLVAGASLYLFSPFFFSGRALAPLDIVSQLYEPWRGGIKLPQVHNHFVTDAVENFIPFRKALHESLRADGYVGWNPYLFGGTAQHANTMLVSHEITMVLHRVVDFWPAWTLGRFFQILVAGFGMAIFLGNQRCGPGITLLGACAYMLNQQFVAWIYFNQVVAAFCWMPWTLWALAKAREESIRFASLAGIFLCLALIGATLQQAAFVLSAFLCLFLGWLWESRGRAVLFWRSMVVLLVAGLVGAGMAAFSLQPSIAAFFENSQAGHGRGQFGYESGWSQPIRNLLGMPLTVYPFLLGSVQTLDLWKLFDLVPFHVGFFGTVPMILAVVSLFSRKVPIVPKLMIVAGSLVPLTPLVGYLYHRFNIVWIFGGCWAACVWLSKTDESQIRRWMNALRRPLVVSVGLWILLSLLLMAGREWLEPWLIGKVLSSASSSQFGFLGEWMQVRAVRLIDYLCIWNPWQLLGLIGFLFSWWGLGCVKKRGPLAFVCALGVLMQLSVFWWQWTTWSQPAWPYGTTPLERLLQKEVGKTGRLAMDTPSRAKKFLPDNTLMPSEVPITGGYDAMHPFGMRSPTLGPWDFPGTTHFLGKISEPHPRGWELVWQEDSWALWADPAPSGGRLVFGQGNSFRPLPLDRFRRPTANTMEVTLPAGSREVEVYSNWHRGWLWQVDGSDRWEKPLLGANRTLRVALPTALDCETKIKFRYDPSPPVWVTAISTGSGCLALFWLCFSPRFFSSARQK